MKVADSYDAFLSHASISESWLACGIIAMILWMGFLTPVAMWAASGLTGGRGMIAEIRRSPGLGCLFAVVCLLGGPFLIYPGLMAVVPVLGLALLRLIMGAMAGNDTSRRR
jgi:hypothetical protein